MFWERCCTIHFPCILIDRDELESLCDAVGFPKGRSNRTAMGDAFRSATGDIYERRVVKTDSGPQIFKVYCRDNQGGKRLCDLP